MAYIRAIKDMYERVKTSFRTPTSDTEYFPIGIGLHQVLALSSFLFTIVIDELTRKIQDEVPCCFLVDDVLVLLTKLGMNLTTSWSNADIP